MNIKQYGFVTLLMILSFTGCQEKKATAEEAVPPPAPPLPLHPDFSIDSEMLKEMVSDLPEEIQENILERPKDFLDLIEKMLDLPQELLVLVNKETSLSAEDTPENLVDLDEYKEIFRLSRPGHQIRETVLPALMAMNEAAQQAGLNLMISSTYRSYNYQIGLYNRYVEQDGKEAADRYSARPGKSQHQLGTAIDFGSIDESFASTQEGIWLKKHAGEFGFSLSYPEGMEDVTGYMWECWHYRYISTIGTEMEKEFFGGIQEYMLRFFHDKKEILSNHRI